MDDGQGFGFLDLFVVGLAGLCSSADWFAYLLTASSLRQSWLKLIDYLSLEHTFDTKPFLDMPPLD